MSFLPSFPQSLRYSMLASLVLFSCQPVSRPVAFQPVNAPAYQAANRAANQATASGNEAALQKLKLSPALMQLLRQPDDEPEPRNQDYDEALVAKLLDPSYVHAHSYYFDHLDRDGQSTVESILRHDGHSQAADLVKNWRQVLSEGSVWPDRNSTTYKGRFTALEHGQVSRTKGWFMFRNASTKADEYYRLAVQSWHSDLPATHAAQKEAWAWLGRTSHFIQDLTVPFHTKSMVRPAQALYHHGYELSSERLFDQYLPSQNHNPDGVWAAGGPYPASGQWGLYFEPGTTAEQMIFQLEDQSRPFYTLVNKSENSPRAQWEKSRSVMIPVGAKSTAGLVMSFLNDVGALR